MTYILLSNGKTALIDDEDYELLVRGTWHEHSGGYAYGWHPDFCTAKQKVYMHKILLPEAGRVDHINRVKLDNRKGNLRSCSQRQNTWNSVGSRNGTSKHKGVSWNTAKGKWIAQIRVFGKSKFLGYYGIEDAAARAYKLAAKELHKEFQCKP